MSRRDVRARRPAYRAGRGVDRGPRCVVGRRCGRSGPRAHAGALDAEHPLYVIYTSVTTAKPKGILHTTGGYLGCRPRTGRSSTSRTTDVFWTAADIGWVTATPTSSTARSPTARPPSCTRARRTPRTRPMVGDHREAQDHDPLLRPHRHSHLHEVGRGHPRQFDLSSLRLMGSVGEPSTRRPTSGTARTSAGAAPRSSTPGGRRKQARS